MIGQPITSQTKSVSLALMLGVLMALAPLEEAAAQPQTVSARCAATVQGKTGAAWFRQSLPQGQLLLDDGRYLAGDSAAARYLKAVVDGCKRTISPAWDLASDIPGSDLVVVVKPQDDTPADAAINAALRDPQNAGKWIYVPAGQYTLMNSLEFRNGDKLIADQAAIFHRGFASSAWDRALIQGLVPRAPNGNPRPLCMDEEAPCVIAETDGSKPRDYPEQTAPYKTALPLSPEESASTVEIIGGTWRNVTHDGMRMPGRIAQWIGNDWSLTGLMVASWGAEKRPAFGIVIIGNRAAIRHIVMSDPFYSKGVDGIHILGGTGTEVAYADIMSGDDSLAALTNCRDGAGRQCTYSELNITDAYFHDARVASAHARAIALGIGRQPVTGPNKKSDFPSRAYVARMRYENIDGYSFGWTDQTDFAGTVTDLSARDRPNKKRHVLDITLRNVSLAGVPTDSKLADLFPLNLPLRCGLMVNASGTGDFPVRLDDRSRLLGRMPNINDNTAFCGQPDVLEQVRIEPGP
ncbi:MAG: hypothetical protein E6R12_04500 [Sphingomonadales bacterium]|nr:MAG: hypothetical protein E6R12_04500 [Sphingomonadales bacterium]